MISQISNAERKQRRGRVGRDKDGEIYHIYSYETQQKMEEFSIPNITKENLTMYILQCLKLNSKISNTNNSLFLIEFLKSKICPKVYESLVYGAISLNEKNLITDTDFNNLETIIKKYGNGEEINNNLDISVNIRLERINFSNLLNFQIFTFINNNKYYDNNIKNCMKILLLCFESNYINFNNKNRYVDDIDFLLDFFNNNYETLKDKDKDKFENLSKLYFNEEIDQINNYNINDDVLNTIKYEILKSFAIKNKAYFINNKLFILSKRTSFDENNEYLLEIELNRDSKCKLIDNTIYYFIKISLIDNMSIQYCFMENEDGDNDEIEKFKKMVKKNIKKKSNIINKKTTTEQIKFKSETMKTLRNKFLPENRENRENDILKNYIFDQNDNDENLIIYKELIKRQ